MPDCHSLFSSTSREAHTCEVLVLYTVISLGFLVEIQLSLSSFLAVGGGDWPLCIRE